MNGDKVLKIKAYPRIHVTLIGMNGNGYRINGGIGFSITQPSIRFRFFKSAAFYINDKRHQPLEDQQRMRLIKKLYDVKKDFNFKFEIDVLIEGDLPIHSGFGSGTIIRLACIEGLFRINNCNYSEELITTISGRGGTSGIGIRTYFNGGYVFDIGHKNVGQKLLPSSSMEKHAMQSLIVAQGYMPDWQIGICYPKNRILVEESEEYFFNKNAVLSDKDVTKTLYEVVFGVLAGISENDITSFENGVKQIQLCGWKKKEKDLYSDLIYYAEKVLYECGATAVGMSSLGPGLYFTSNDIDLVIDKSKAKLLEWHVFTTMMKNSGRTITEENA